MSRSERKIKPYDVMKEIPTSALQFPTPDGLTDQYNKHLFQYPDILREYISIYGADYDMYSESLAHALETPYVCTLNHTSWKKPNKKDDVLNAQKLILKHIIIYFLLKPIQEAIIIRLRQTQDYFGNYTTEFERECELRFVESKKVKHFGQLCDSNNRNLCSPIERDTNQKELLVIFQKYHTQLNEQQIEANFRSLYDHDLKYVYEYVIATKASISACHNQILAIQTIGIGQMVQKQGSAMLNSFGLNSSGHVGSKSGMLTTMTDKSTITSASTRDLHGSSIVVNRTKTQGNELNAGRRGSQGVVPTAFDFYFSPDIICLLWHQEYEKQYQNALLRQNITNKERFMTRQKEKIKAPLNSKAGRGPFHLSRYTHWGAGLEITQRYLPEAQKAQETFSIFSLVLTPEELRGSLSTPPPYHVIDRNKYGSVLDLKEAKEVVNPSWVTQCYQEQFVSYAPHPGLPTRVELSFLPSPPQKLYNLELTALNYSLSGSSHLDIFVRYLEVEGEGLEMYSECRMGKLKDVYSCQLNHFKSTFLGIGKKNRKVDKTLDLYAAQKLILKHAVITQRLYHLFGEMMNRYRQVMTDYLHYPQVEDYFAHEKEQIAKTQKHAVMYGSLVDHQTTLTLLGANFQEMFNCYHRYTYNKAWLLLDDKDTGTLSNTSLTKKLSVNDIYNDLFLKHLPLSYELIFRLKILLYSLYDSIIIVQSLVNDRWQNEVRSKYLHKDIQPDILCCLWFQHYHRSSTSQSNEEDLDVERKMLFRQPNCFQSALENNHNKPFLLQSLTLSDEENRTLFRPPPPDAVIDVHMVLDTVNGGFDGKSVPAWVQMAYCNRFSMYASRPQIPIIRLPVLPAEVVDNSNFKAGSTKREGFMPEIFKKNSSPIATIDGSSSSQTGFRLSRIFSSKPVIESDDQALKNRTDSTGSIGGRTSISFLQKENGNRPDGNNGNTFTPPSTTKTLSTTRGNLSPNIGVGNTPSAQTRTLDIATAPCFDESSLDTPRSTPTTTTTTTATTTNQPQKRDSVSKSTLIMTPQVTANKSISGDDDDDDDDDEVTRLQLDGKKGTSPPSTQRTSFRDSFLFRWAKPSNRPSSTTSTTTTTPPGNKTKCLQNEDSFEDDDIPYIVGLDEARAPIIHGKHLKNNGQSGRSGKSNNKDEKNIELCETSKNSKNSKNSQSISKQSSPSIKSAPAPTPLTLKHQSPRLSTSTISLNGSLSSCSQGKPESVMAVERLPSFEENTSPRLSAIAPPNTTIANMVIVDDDDDFFLDSILISYELPM